MLVSIGSFGKAVARSWSCRGRGGTGPAGSLAPPGSRLAWEWRWRRVRRRGHPARLSRGPDRPAARQPESLAAAGRARWPVHGDHPVGSRTGPGQHAADARRHHEPAHGLPRLPCLPAGGAPSDLPLPVLTVEQGGAARTLRACPSRNAPVHFPAVSGSAASAAGAGGFGAAAPPPRQLEFFKPPQSTFNNGGLASADTSYVLAYLARPRRHACGEQGRGHVLHYFYRR
jgi:hypothetical protein